MRGFVDTLKPPGTGGFSLSVSVFPFAALSHGLFFLSVS
ncbi:hypothetical protein B4123_2433 [Bacillus paralicheniformis]|jgi:hypothetical protein|nr:hypothetical protein B4123_2433 [Bacillus paralicheniformis]TWJ52031.1 hypothetical protein CHCC5023_4152 [Bacillus paralicheniformis]TWK42410.1 hypothetical protein CHCC20347_2524 [Bacillus paralicheniformis]TWL04210.1 hypothetical protein CHCC19468_1068 [Bacillus paralicheniformis]TWL10107.1 hypothetical protein CHCC19467_2379 [Bacillus paralicheniformis]